MNSILFNRSTGVAGPQVLQQTQTARLIEAIQPAPNIRFDSSTDPSTGQNNAHPAKDESGLDVWAHRAGVNSIVIDKWEGRYMLSGGADGSLSLWDFENADNASWKFTHNPVVVTAKDSSTHKYGITHLSFYPFDPFACLSSSYDHQLKVSQTETLSVSATFNLDSVIYSHALSPIADHLLVACATQHPAIRLVDLKSGSSAHALPGHQGAVLSVAWSPRDEHILASGGSDGTLRLWDIRRSVGSLGVMDMEDSVGILGEDGFGKKARLRDRGKAHIGPCNGIVWTDDGNYLVSDGHDERIRVWDTSTGANMLSHFGPTVKNTHLSALLPLLPPSHVTAPGRQVMFYPNEKEVLMFDIFEGTLLKRLRAPGVNVAQARGGAGQRNIRHRITSLAWRSGHIELYSAHSDGVIRAWLPRTQADIDFEKGEEEDNEGPDDEDGGKKRKREALDEIFRDLTRQKITFT